MQAARPEAKRRAGGRSGFAGGFRFFRHASRVSSKSHAPGAGQSAAKAVAVGCGCRPLRVVQLGANADCCEMQLAADAGLLHVAQPAADAGCCRATNSEALQR